eukprot:IDg20760t1
MEVIQNPLSWGLDPLFHVHVKVLAKMLKHMQPGQGTGRKDAPVYFYQFNAEYPPRPLRLVAVGGILVKKQAYKKLTRFVMDDGSETMNCMYWNDSARDVVGEASEIVLGQFLHVLGKLEWKLGVACIVASRITVATRADAESIWWSDLAEVHENAYSKKFEISQPTSLNRK